MIRNIVILILILSYWSQGMTMPRMEEIGMNSPKKPAIRSTSSKVKSAPELESRLIPGKQPKVRVGLLDGYNNIDFRVLGPFAISTLEGEIVFSDIESTRRWRSKVESSVPAKFVYSILVKVCDNEKEAIDFSKFLTDHNHPARILPYGRELVISGEVIHVAKKWRVIVGAFDTEEQARPHMKTFTEDDSLRPVILRHRIEEPSGRIEIYDSEYERNAMVNEGFIITPLNPDGEITVYNVEVGAGFHWERKENRVYRGSLEIRIDNSGYIMAINELDLDEYLMGVVPSEMHYTYPLEALKAQAVAARSYTVSKLSNRPASDPMDFPATVSFQAYSGVTYQNKQASDAVTATAGEVLKVNDKVCEAYFSANSGGFTENKENWSPPAESYLVGRPMVSDNKFKLDLTRENDVKKWVTSHPENFSNPRGTRIDMLDRNARYFRWEVTYSRKELEDIIRRKLGQNIGTLIDLQPLTRGVSGRITELEILGTHRNIRLVGELNIRRALAESTLYSSCFIIKPVIGDLGHPIEITLVGAGFGHGVGMDQTACGVMASKGIKYEEILKFFYKDSEIEKIW